MAVSKQPDAGASSESEVSDLAHIDDESCGFEFGCGPCRSKRLLNDYE